MNTHTITGIYLKSMIIKANAICKIRKHFEKQLADTFPIIVFQECTTLVMDCGI